MYIHIYIYICIYIYIYDTHVLYCTTLFHAYAMPAMLCYAMLCYTILYYTIMYSKPYILYDYTTTLLYYYTIYYSTTRLLCYSIAAPARARSGLGPAGVRRASYTMLYYAILCYTMLYYAILCYTMLYYNLRQYYITISL